MKPLQILRCIGIVFLLLSGMACNDQVVNSNMNDKKKAAVAKLPGGPNFKAAITAVIDKCAGCHSEWYGYSEQAYEDMGLIVFGNLSASELYYRLSNSTQGPGPKNMPQGGGAALTDGEVELLETWINGVIGG